MSPPRSLPLADLLRQVRGCTRCVPHLPLGPRPVLQFDAAAPILIAGQAPGRRVHRSGVPFDDPSGERLRDWLGVSRETFYHPGKFAILPMGLCYPGSTRNGDLPPRPECAPAWRGALLERLTGLRLTLVLGQYAQRYHLGPQVGGVTDCVRDWRRSWPAVLALPHPSPRNRGWFTRHPWFEQEVVPALRARVAAVLAAATGEATQDVI